ncbi:MAG: nucleotidyl transferase AbiEii/AbiGii toxin family protein [Moorellaceae bacterium]
MWEELLMRAVYILESSNIPAEEWTWGGGTALAFYFRHRESRDIDVFLTDAQYLTLLSPRLNRTAQDMTHDYVESSNFLKLKFPVGDVDFIIAPHLTVNYFLVERFEGKNIRVETPEEIVLKKLFYRAESLKARDIIDVAVVYERRKEHLLEYASLLSTRIELLALRWEKIERIFPQEVAGLQILEPELKDKAAILFKDFLKEIQH